VQQGQQLNHQQQQQQPAPLWRWSEQVQLQQQQQRQLDLEADQHEQLRRIKQRQEEGARQQLAFQARSDTPPRRVPWCPECWGGWITYVACCHCPSCGVWLSPGEKIFASLSLADYARFNKAKFELNLAYLDRQRNLTPPKLRRGKE